MLLNLRRGGAVLAAGPLVLATACGPPADATVAEFCGAYVDGAERIFGEVDVEHPDYEDLADGFHGWADELEDAGTPVGISEDARAGFEAMLTAIGELSASELEEYWTSDDQDAAPFEVTDDIAAFEAYAGETCVEGGSGSG